MQLNKKRNLYLVHCHFRLLINQYVLSIATFNCHKELNKESHSHTSVIMLFHRGHYNNFIQYCYLNKAHCNHNRVLLSLSRFEKTMSSTLCTCLKVNAFDFIMPDNFHIQMFSLYYFVSLLLKVHFVTHSLIPHFPTFFSKKKKKKRFLKNQNPLGI